MRHIPDALVDWLTTRIDSPSATPRELFVQAALALEGVREVGGNNRGPVVELLQRTLGAAEREPWCMSLVQSCLAYVETMLGVTSPIFPSEHCLTVWNSSPISSRVRREPLPGAIVVWKHGSSAAGHTGILLKNAEGRLHTLEGNTEAGLGELGSLVREGGGVYSCVRDRHANGSMRVVGFLKPF